MKKQFVPIISLVLFMLNFDVYAGELCSIHKKTEMKQGSGDAAAVIYLMSLNPPLLGGVLLLTQKSNDEIYRRARPNDDICQIHAHEDVMQAVGYLSLFNLSLLLVDQKSWWIGTVIDCLFFSIPGLFGLYSLEEVNPSQNIENIQTSLDMKMLK